MVEIQVLYIVILGLFGLGLGFGISKLLDRAKLSGCTVQAEQIIRKAKDDSDSILRQSEIKAKEDYLKRKEEMNNEFEKTRMDLRDLEKRLEKREDGVEDKLRDMQKRERLTETLQLQLQNQKNEWENKNKRLVDI
ncbi:MAG: Rnase Y domain-containing protein, partial [Planctomycetia bacterium]